MDTYIRVYAYERLESFEGKLMTNICAEWQIFGINFESKIRNEKQQQTTKTLNLKLLCFIKISLRFSQVDVLPPSLQN